MFRFLACSGLGRACVVVTNSCLIGEFFRGFFGEVVFVPVGGGDGDHGPTPYVGGTTIPYIQRYYFREISIIGKYLGRGKCCMSIDKVTG